MVGAGSHAFDGPRLAAYRDAADPGTGDDLLATVGALEQAGSTVHSETLTWLPRGFTAGGEGAYLLRHKALHASAPLPAALATDPQLIPALMRHWRTFTSQPEAGEQHQDGAVAPAHRPASLRLPAPSPSTSAAAGPGPGG